ncbi:histidine kinase [Bradyrhizobium sp. U87765 SZCCT0131]|nr:histidine kinase [Bradyrhizobium sp. U87765 SZCCT0131]MBR1265850.1 histidine kinase [Bradyrhizobium sp. U87765 SZCCT0134]MBR1308726.1 histidine kinase [Bradyrhizobium sp. U87765 SZCCT0110]MBR1318584.1 histidine kinase [Bradyrhizobium sp. U87765 SZCCT0109]MBR1352288.1 histidine kinase [Bradyrhizobium sp. U87765 SZCCT0048]
MKVHRTGVVHERGWGTQGLRSFGFIRRLSLTHRLLALTLVASVPGLLALSYNAFDLRKARYAEVHDEALRNTLFAVSELDQIFAGIKGVLHAVAQAAEIREAGPEACSRYVRQVRQGLEALTSILIVNPNGSVRCFSEAPSSAANLADRVYFQDVLRKRAFSVGTYTTSRVSGRPLVPVALPLVEGESVTGVVMAGLNLQWLGRQLNERGVARGSAITIADRDGIIIAREPAPDTYIGTRIKPTGIGYVTAPAAGSAEIESPDGTTRIAGYVPAALTPFGLYVSTGISRDEVLRPIDEATRRSLLVFSLGSLVALVLAWLVGEGIIRQPLMKVVATAEAWRRGHDMARTGIIDRGDEIGLLGQTFDRLMDESQQRESERETAEARREILVHELAHRVKNTLATVQSIASLSFRHSQGPDALRGFQDRLQALVRSHDLLTQRNWEHADITDIMKVALAPLREDKGHRFALSGPAVDLPPTSAVPVAMIVHELCTNAMKYGALSNDRGTVALHWTAAPDERGTAVSMTWSEAGGPPVERPQQEGFGSRLIANLTRQMHGGVEVRYPPSGLVCHLKFVTPKAEPRTVAETAAG